MRKRALIILVALLVGLSTALVSSPAPAQAASWSGTESHCKTGGDAFYAAAICVEWQYRIQDDGDGLRIEGVWVDINQGCGEMDSPAILRLGIGWDTTSGQPNNGSIFNSGTGDCHFYKDLEVKGPDTGPLWAWGALTVNVNNGPTDYWYFNPKLCAYNAC